MDKLKMHSPDLTQQNIDKLLELFPNCKTEKQDDNGNLSIAVDFDLLKQELSKNIVEGPKERYQLNWPGKKEALLTANAPIAKTLRPCREESVDFDTTENLFIEGDNLDALKLLQETYLGKVKMIYIDPPYNTGKDFIYADNFSESTDEYLQGSGQKDDEGNRLIANTDSNGRFHSDWLSMMYSRLRLARILLSDDGVVFISIDDNEGANLKKVCDEIFGESCFVSDLCIVNNLKGRNDKKHMATANERLLMYVRSESFNEYGLDLPESFIKDYKFEDETGKYRLIELRKRGGADTRVERPNMYYPFFMNPGDGSLSLELSGAHSITVLPTKSDGTHGRWRWGKDTALKNINELVARKVNNLDKYNVYEKDYLETKGELKRIKPKSVWSGADYSTDTATKNYRALMGKIDFNNPKPVPMIEDLVTYASDTNCNHIIMDFFSGSGTTAHAIFSRNAFDGGARRFIMVQLQENIEKVEKAYTEGYRVISDVTKERIRRAGKKIKEENPEATNLDTGFRVLKIDSSNMNDVHYTPDTVSKDDLFNQVEHIKSDRTSEDLLFQVMLDWGVDLSLPISKETIEGKEVYFVNDDDQAPCDLVACFEKGIDEPLIKALAAKEPLRVVFRDDGFASDSLKINVEQIFKQLAPATDIKVI